MSTRYYKPICPLPPPGWCGGLDALLNFWSDGLKFEECPESEATFSISSAADVPVLQMKEWKPKENEWYVPMLGNLPNKSEIWEQIVEHPFGGFPCYILDVKDEYVKYEWDELGIQFATSSTIEKTTEFLKKFRFKKAAPPKIGEIPPPSMACKKSIWQRLFG